ncbi:MAG: Tim44/TimA family putative adaptor protein [Rhodobacteraceae bacterium]|nr:Tim44/TimA family putative adaptor protein [Paracoccaceae bacterium]
MGSSLIQLLFLAVVVVFLVMRLMAVLGTREGFEPKTEAKTGRNTDHLKVVEGSEDPDIADFAEADSPTGRALAEMKRTDRSFNVSEFVAGSRQAYEMILMAFEQGDLKLLESLLAPDIYESFSAVIHDREEKGYEVEATFIGVRELTLKSARFEADEKEGEITMRFVGELTSVVKDSAGDVVEGSASEIKRQTNIWTFARLMGTDNPNWLLVATDE